MNSHLQVHWWDGTPVGQLVNRGSIYFFYEESWVNSGRNLSPLNLPFRAASGFNGHKGVDGLAGLIADCLPDQWGRLVAEREFERNGWGKPTTMGLLAWRGARGIGALQFLPAISAQGRPSDGRLEAINLAALAKGADEIERGQPSEVFSQLAQGGSPGGRRPKALVLAYPDDTLSVGVPDGVGTPSLLKFDLSIQKQDAPSEHAYARMAAAAGIRVVTTRLIEERSTDRRHLLVERFDTPSKAEPERRLHCHSLSTLLHKTPGVLDYRDLFRAAIRLGTPLKELEEIARRMVFNVLASNADDHGKNHAFLYDEKSKTWSMTLAYDLVYSPMMLERGMTIAGEVWPSVTSMEALSVDAGLSRSSFTAIVDQVGDAVADWPRHAEAAGVPATLTTEISERIRKIRQSVFPKQVAMGNDEVPILPSAPDVHLLPKAHARPRRR